MNLHKSMNRVGLKALLCLFWLTVSVAHSAHADGRYRVSVKVVNQTATPLVLSAASWVVSPERMRSYAVPAHGTGNFSLIYASKKKGAMNFSYSADKRSCTFKAGYDTNYSFGWFKANEEAFQWVDATSDGLFGAVCKGRVVSNQPDEGYTVEFRIE